MIKNIIFDMGNVLLSYEPKIYVRKIIHDVNTAEAVLRELFQGPEWPMLDAGTLTEEDAVKRIQARIPQYAESVQCAMDGWDEMMTPLPGMLEIVAALKENGYRLYVLSNASLRFFSYYEQKEVFHYFDGFVVSAKEKIVKPDPEIYCRLLKRFDLKAEECLFIDDMQQNIAGASKVGMYGHCFEGADELKSYFKGIQIFRQR